MGVKCLSDRGLNVGLTLSDLNIVNCVVKCDMTNDVALIFIFVGACRLSAVGATKEYPKTSDIIDNISRDHK